MIKGWHGREYEFVSSFVDGHAGMVKMKGGHNPCSLAYGPGWQLYSVQYRRGDAGNMGQMLHSAAEVVPIPCSLVRGPEHSLR